MPAKLYRWDDWFANPRRIFTLVKGVDYFCSQGSMSQQIRNAAHDRGISVRVLERDNQLTVVILNTPKPISPSLFVEVD